jgi:secreted Zn-dependent insulinase-like peptidase
MVWFTPARPTETQHPRLPCFVQLLLAISPIKEYRSLEFNFVLPDTARHYESKACLTLTLTLTRPRACVPCGLLTWPIALQPLHYISHLVGHEGPGSLLSLLKANGMRTRGLSSPRSPA